MKVNGFKQLDIWQKGHSVALKIYKLTKHLPREEQFGISNQIRRSAVSICANIAEGYCKSTKEFLRFLGIARGSLEETKHYLILIQDLGYCSSDQFDLLFEELECIGKMIYSLKLSLSKKLKG